MVKQKGIATLELACASVFVLILIVGVLEAANYLRATWAARHSSSEAAREYARLAKDSELGTERAVRAKDKALHALLVAFPQAKPSCRSSAELPCHDISVVESQLSPGSRLRQVQVETTLTVRRRVFSLFSSGAGGTAQYEVFTVRARDSRALDDTQRGSSFNFNSVHSND